MDADIDLVFVASAKDVSTLETIVPQAYLLHVDRLDRESARVSLRYRDTTLLHIASSVGDLLKVFLGGLSSAASVISRSRAEVRIGIFYDLTETVIFPLVLPAECVEALAALRLSVNSTGYPCNEETSN
ncbi:MAG TPA: hypothetical protein VHC22_19315 [Pirellulales bacterium]|nr:hypothetical protein [Pirellulales bacterium]